MKPIVYNKRHRGNPASARLIDRTTPYGNPFVIGRDGDRDDVCDKFECWVMEPDQRSLRERAKKELRGRDLLCWCKPKRCHGDMWLRIVND